MGAIFVSRKSGCPKPSCYFTTSTCQNNVLADNVCSEVSSPVRACPLNFEGGIQYCNERQHAIMQWDPGRRLIEANLSGGGKKL